MRKEQLPFQQSNPFVRTVPNTQYQNQAFNPAGQNVFVHPHVRMEEDLALIRMHQHTDKQILEEKKRVQGLNKRDFPEFPANKDLAPEEYIEFRQYFFMIACSLFLTQTMSCLIDVTTYLHQGKIKSLIIGPDEYKMVWPSFIN